MYRTHIKLLNHSFLVSCSWISRAEGSSKIHSRLEQQTSRLSQQVKNNSTSSNSSNNKSSTSSKSSPIKEKTSPASPMDDIERGNKLSPVTFSLQTFFKYFDIFST